MEPKGRLARWIMDLQEFNFSIKHRAGRIHTNADALSRLVHPHGDNGSGGKRGLRITDCGLRIADYEIITNFEIILFFLHWLILRTLIA